MSLRSIAHAAFGALGLEVRRRPRPAAPPPLLDDPLEALHLARGGGDVALRCPLDRCVAYNGFGYGPGSWHPFSATLEELRADPSRGYEGSALEAYFRSWTPANAADALIGADEAPGLEPLPAHAFLFPWVSTTPEERRRAVEWIVLSENRRHAGRPLPVSAGYNQHGPVTTEKGRIEHARLAACLRALEGTGWDRSRGDAMVTLVRRGDALRYLVLHGHHRAAAASVAGLEAIPARFGIPAGVRVDEAGHWPQVRRGLWTEAGAAGYADHLFDFDARPWAAARGLLPTPTRGDEVTERHRDPIRHGSE